MNKINAIKQLHFMANQLENNFEKLVSLELAKQDDPIEFISDVKEL